MQANRLYIANFDDTVTNKELEELFSTYGEVKEVKVLEGKGSGLVDMSSQKESEKAKKALNGTFFKGRPLKILE